MSRKSRPDCDRPITDLCIVSRQDSIPAGFDVLLTTRDAHDDCNLWPESFFGTHTERYLCFCRNVLHQYWSDADRVLVDITLTGEKDIPPTGFTVIHHTRDARERATKKKVICMKMKPRKAVEVAICELIMVSHKRNIPPGFNIKGELNGMALCVRLISVLPSPLSLAKLPSPLHQQQQMLPQVQRLSMQPGWIPPQPSSSLYDPYRQQAARQSGVSNFSMYSTGRVFPNASYNMPYSSSPPYSGIETRFSILRDSPLKGVPFVLDKRFIELEEAYKIGVDEVLYRSPVDLDNEYSYSFDKEEKAVQKTLPNWTS